MSTSSAADSAALAAAAAAAAAAQAAARASAIEMWTLYAIGVIITVLRTYARVKAVGFKNLRADDYLAWAAAVFYTTQTSLGYSIGAVAEGFANNGMTDAEREALSPSDPEFALRVIGSKIQVAGWSSYATLTFLLKMAVLVFYIRLTEGLGRRYRMRIWIGFGLVGGTFIASILTILLGCMPFHKYWQINPDPGNICEAGVSLPIVWVTFSSNILTDIYLIMIPIPMLWSSTLRLYKKVLSTIVLGAGIFVLVAATLKTVYVLTDPVNGGQLAGSWGIREIFVSILTTNLPMIFPLMKVWFRPLFGSILNSTRKEYKTPSGFRTIGGGGGSGGGGGDNSNNRTINRKGPASVNPMTNISFTESEERMMNDVQLKVYANGQHAADNKNRTGIVVSNEVEVTSEDRNSHNGDNRATRVHEQW